MTGEKAKVEPFVKLTRELLRSDAWRSLGINGYRLVTFVMLEHMRHAGKKNGLLKAPRQQLEMFGVGARHMTDAIRNAEEVGLLDCVRGGERVATTYALTWLPMHDGSQPSHRWREYKNLTLQPIPQPKNRNLPAKGKSELLAKGKSHCSNLPAKGKSDCPETLLAKGKHPYRKESYHDGREDSEQVEEQDSVPGLRAAS